MNQQKQNRSKKSFSKSKSVVIASQIPFIFQEEEESFLLSIQNFFLKDQAILSFFGIIVDNLNKNLQASE
jgi:hypothetical protein